MPGWQRQDNAFGIESVIMQVLERIHHHPVEITASGRTDAGVHAIAQVFHFDSELGMSREQWLRAMNALLPPDIRMQDIVSVHDGFHARFDAVSKRYDYYLSYDVDNPFLQRYRAFYRGKLDAERMRGVRASLHRHARFHQLHFQPDRSAEIPYPHRDDVRGGGDGRRPHFLP